VEYWNDGILGREKEWRIMEYWNNGILGRKEEWKNGKIH
jgi:hypothetical protein